MTALAPLAPLPSDDTPRDACPACGHEWRRHDPEDGRCDAFSDEPGRIGACRCGRDVAFTAEANARLARAALVSRRRTSSADIAHGTESMYTLRQCRCDDCRAAATEARRRRRQRAANSQPRGQA